MSFLKHEICVIRNSGNDIQMSCQSLVYIYIEILYIICISTLYCKQNKKNKS